MLSDVMDFISDLFDFSGGSSMHAVEGEGMFSRAIKWAFGGADAAEIGSTARMGGGVIEAFLNGETLAFLARSQGARTAAELADFYFDVYWDKQIYNDMRHGFKGGFQEFQQTAEYETLQSVRETATHHATMLRELEGDHVSNYKSQILEPHFTGTAPTEESLKKYYQKLSSKLHPDKQANSPDDIKKAFEERFKDAKAAYEHLKDPQKTASFTQEAQTNPEQLRTIVEEMSSGKWDKVRAKAEKAAQDNTRLRIEGPEQQSSGAFSKFMAKRSPNEKVALAFAGVATVGLGVYGAAKWMESRKETQRNKETDAENSWTHKIEKDTLAPSAAASAR